MKISTLLKILTVAGLVVVVALIAASKSLDSTRYQAYLADRVRAATGLELSFSGPTKIKLGLAPQVSFTGLTLATKPNGPALLYVDRVEARVALLPLLLRRIQVERLALLRPVMKLGPLPRPQAALDLSDGADKAPATAFAITDLVVEDGVVLWRDPQSVSESSLRLGHGRIQAEGGAGGALSLQLDGRHDGADFQVTGVIGAAAGLMSGKPYPLQLKGTVSGVVVVARGQVADPWAGKGIDLELRAQGDELADLAKRLGVVGNEHPLGPIGPYKVSARLTDAGLAEIEAVLGKRDNLLVTLKGAVRHPLALVGLDLAVSAEADSLAGLSRLMAVDIPNGGPLKLAARLNDIDDGWRLTGIKSSLGRSDFAGELALVKGVRPRLVGRLAANAFFPGDLSFPQGHNGETLPSAPQRPAIPVQDDRILSVEALPLDWLKSVDMTLSLTATRLHLGSAVLGDAAGEVSLSASKLVVDSLAAKLGEGTLKGDGRIDLSGRLPFMALRLSGTGLDLSRLGGEGGLENGRGEISLDLKASGASRRALASSLDGGLSLTATDVSIAPARGPLPDILAALDPTAPAADRTRLRCVALKAIAKAGQISLDRGLRLESNRIAMVGGGGLDLRSESLDMGFVAKGGAWTRLRGFLGAPKVAAEGGAVRLSGDGPGCRSEAKPRR
ncbi:hypothetical protein A6A04_13165 [Paramagnetospirillum marisnigri]|uniref:AsmA domain-containing protein n=1 Tax=Paramagnetospirillum marisnigri TaxID=1285242 RepID=A0A178MV23_9PROT|nr:AsmA family protein [Paramagnetospirillum marisnigri]OAN53841.1 hypothetical protein A6A04_13165 [Paramagnetospirillum marisnigri]